MNAPPAATVAVPLLASLSRANVTVPPSTEVAVTVPPAGVSSLVVAVSSLAIGASSTGVMVMSNVAGAVGPLPSSTVKVKLSTPLALGVGV